MTLAEILNCDRLTSIVDVGASPIDGPPPYKAMLDHRLCTVIGFEPNQAALTHLNAEKCDLESYSPDIIGAQGKALLRVFPDTPGLNSLLEPDLEAMKAFPNFTAWATPCETESIRTIALSDAVRGPMDLLKVDIQGGELDVFRNAGRLMNRVVAVHTEVSFITLYKDQPTFGDVDQELRSHGLVPHAFTEIKKWMIAPMHSTRNPSASINQLLEADIVYVRDFTKMDLMTDEQLQHLAMIAHYCYGSKDLVVRCLTWLTRRGKIPIESAAGYLSGTLAA